MLSDRPSGAEYTQFLPWWRWAADNLNSLIEPGKNWESEDTSKSGWYQLLNEARNEYEKGEESGVVRLANLINLAEDLDYLQESKPSVFDRFKAALASNMTADAGYLTGKWFEVRTARLLVEADIPFSSPEPPDYQIENFGIGVECHSPRLEEGGDVYQKTIGAINKKERKYHGESWFKDQSTVLMLDATWLVRAENNEVIARNESLPNDLLWGLQETVDDDGFDLVIAFLFGHAIDEHSDEKAVSCVYAPDPVQDEELGGFKDKLLSKFRREDVKIRLQDLPS
jgi:hypothetical protein